MKKLTTEQFGSRFLSFLFIVTIITEWRNVFVGIEMAYQANQFNSAYLLIIVMGILFFTFNLIAAIGLYCFKKWGFIFSYIAIPFSTFFFATTYIPLVTKLFSAQSRWMTLSLINLLLILCLIYLDIRLRRQEKNGKPIKKG